MKTTKILMMAVLALVMNVSCSNDDNEPIHSQPAEARGITITAQLLPKDGGNTRSVSDQTTYVKAEWATGEHIAILYEKSSTKYVADAEITAVNDETGVATITFTVEEGTLDDTECTLVYPLSAAKADHSGVKDYADLLAAQDGVLDGDLDVRVGAGKIQVTTPGLDVTTQPAPQYSIFNFMLKDITGNSNKNATNFMVQDAAGNVITTVTPGSATNNLYVALPALPAGFFCWFKATVEGKAYIANAMVSTATTAGYYYQTQLKLATIGDVILSNGSFAAKGTSGEQAVIAYIGFVDKYFEHFLAIALENARPGYIDDWNSAQTLVGTYAANHPITLINQIYNSNSTNGNPYDIVKSNSSISSATAETLRRGWRLPTVTDFRYIFAGLCELDDPTPTSPVGIKQWEAYGTGSTLVAKINTACGNTHLSGTSALSSNSMYYSSSSDDHVWYYYFYSSHFTNSDKTTRRGVRAVFAY